jgi:hypothetical protein
MSGNEASFLSRLASLGIPSPKARREAPHCRTISVLELSVFCYDQWISLSPSSV